MFRLMRTLKLIKQTFKALLDDA